MARSGSILVFTAAVLAAVSLGCGGPGPGDAVEKFQRLVEEGSVEEASEMVSGEVLAVIPREKLKGALTNQTREISKKGGIASIDILSEELQGNTATVVVSTTMGDGSKDEQTIQLTKIDGEWKFTPDMKK